MNPELLNAFETVFANIKFMAADKPVASIAITSSVAGEGKTEAAWCLAQVIASTGKSVALVDGDMRHPTLAQKAGLQPKAGIRSVLSGTASLADAMVPAGPEGLSLLAAEADIPNPADVVSSPAFKDLMASLAGSYDYVVVDTPALGDYIDAAIISTLVDGMVLVAQVQSTKRKDLAAAADQLRKVGANILGTVATNVSKGV